METARERICALMNKARASKMVRIRSAAVIAFLLGALLWFTKWPSLRPGLLILLAGQIGLLAILLLRSFAISREMQHARASNQEKDAFASWFDREARFARRSAIAEDLIRTIGFVMLGYGLWTAIGSVPTALALGVAYPAFAYFGMERRKHLQVQRMLQADKDAAIALARDADALI